MIKSGLKQLGLVAVCFMASEAFAATTTTATFQTTATLTASCTITTSNLAFGSITPAATGTANATGTINSICSKGVAYDLSINGGSSGSISGRTMSGAIAGNTDKLAYNIYTTSGGSTLFGDGVTGSSFSLTGTGSQFTTTFYGRLPLNQYLTADTYTDTITAKITY